MKETIEEWIALKKKGYTGTDGGKIVARIKEELRILEILDSGGVINISGEYYTVRELRRDRRELLQEILARSPQHTNSEGQRLGSAH